MRRSGECNHHHIKCSSSDSSSIDNGNSSKDFGNGSKKTTSIHKVAVYDFLLSLTLEEATLVLTRTATAYADSAQIAVYIDHSGPGLSMLHPVDRDSSSNYTRKISLRNGGLRHEDNSKRSSHAIPSLPTDGRVHVSPPLLFLRQSTFPSAKSAEPVQ